MVLHPEKVLQIKTIPLTDPSIPDQLVWPLCKNGSYSVRSGYLLRHTQIQRSLISHPHQSHSISALLWKHLWKLKTLPRIKLFLWRTCQDILPTKEKLYRRHISQSDKCPFCFMYAETSEHALLSCAWTRAVWFAHPISYKVPIQAITSFDVWLELMFSLDASAEFYTRISFLLWRIWKHRCHCLFNSSIPDPLFLALSAHQAAEEFISTHHSCFSVQHEDRRVPLSSSSLPWIPPPLNVIRINTDAAWNASSCEAGLAALARDSGGQLVAGSAKSMLAPSPMTAEALAIREGVMLALSLPCSEIIITSDSKSLISALNSHSSPMDWKASSVISQVRYLLSSTRHVSWTWSSRKANRAADHVASLAYGRKCPSSWVTNPPSSLIEFLRFDSLTHPPLSF